MGFDKEKAHKLIKGIRGHLRTIHNSNKAASQMIKSASAALGKLDDLQLEIEGGPQWRDAAGKHQSIKDMNTDKLLSCIRWANWWDEQEDTRTYQAEGTTSALMAELNTRMAGISR